MQSTPTNFYLNGFCPSSRETSRKADHQENYFSLWSKHVVKHFLDGIDHQEIGL